MKIGIITCNRALNYGARLQAFALFRYLSSLGHEVSVIDYQPWYMRFLVKRIYWPTKGVKSWVKLFLEYGQRCREIKMYKHLQSFSCRNTLLSDSVYQSVEDLRRCPPDVDALIAGSDQIWNPLLHNGVDDAFYLDFGDASVIRLSYAASFAVDHIPDSITYFVRTSLERFNHVSVREGTGAKICGDLGVKSTLVCDPVLLISHGEWSEIAETIEYVSPYVLVYDLDVRSDVFAIAERIAKVRGLRIYAVGPRRCTCCDKDFSGCSVERFLALMRDANCIVSNSLHATLFALIFNRDFYCVRRSDGMNVRISDLLSHYGLDDRLVDSGSTDCLLSANIDYRGVNVVMSNDIRESETWINNALDV